MSEPGTLMTAGERNRLRFHLLTTGAVAERLSDDRITPDTVRGWIEEADPHRRLRAVDLRGKGATKPLWMIDWADVLEFLRRRSNLPANAGAHATPNGHAADDAS